MCDKAYLASCCRLTTAVVYHKALCCDFATGARDCCRFMQRLLESQQGEAPGERVPDLCIAAELEESHLGGDQEGAAARDPLRTHQQQQCCQRLRREWEAWLYAQCMPCKAPESSLRHWDTLEKVQSLQKWCAWHLGVRPKAHMQSDSAVAWALG